ncbi:MULTISPECIES: hypothetical protein [unclassified Nostoc]|uniref:hypothetical protein n=1 Tax=unclassified Nostoc TaxID=2593658 RepID=UPI00132E976D|nr:MULTISPECIES: hypothetical protein [unclassified Nostoc]MBD2506520.1 hypothetical protein [Desmonostoc muscorum FACHB-395]QHG17494.1 hypothetical protein GJB62_16895 [Nostoc sp. ATCC 53789]
MMDTEYVALAAQEYGSIVNHTTCERPKGGYGSKMMSAMRVNGKCQLCLMDKCKSH